MENLIRFSWLRRRGTFWTVVALFFTASCFWITPTEAASKSSRSTQVGAPSLQFNKITRKTRKKVRVKKAARGRRWIQVDLSSQRLVAWEGKKRVYSYRISSGKRSTPTRLGTFAIQRKYRSTRMRGRDYNVPNVPHAMYYSGGYAIHGAYWHNRFGRPVSHGCVNLPVGAARRLYSWAPVGTKVVVQR